MTAGPWLRCFGAAPSDVCGSRHWFIAVRAHRLRATQRAVGCSLSSAPAAICGCSNPRLRGSAAFGCCSKMLLLVAASRTRRMLGAQLIGGTDHDTHPTAAPAHRWCGARKNPTHSSAHYKLVRSLRSRRFFIEAARRAVSRGVAVPRRVVAPREPPRLRRIRDFPSRNSRRSVDTARSDTRVRMPVIRATRAEPENCSGHDRER